MPTHRWLTGCGKSHVLGMDAESQRAGVKDGLKRGGLNKVLSVWRILESQKETGRKPILDGYRIPFIFKSGGAGPGMGYRADGTVVARASLPEFATSRVVNCYDIYLTDIYRNLTILSLPLEVWMFSGRIRPSRIIPSNLFHGATSV